MNRNVKVMAAAILASLALLSGCGPVKGLGLGRPTAVSLAKRAVERVQNAQSAAIALDADARVSMKQQSLGVSMDIDVDIDLDMEATRSPQRTKGTADIQMGLFGQSEKIPLEFYTDVGEDGVATTYSRLADGKWTKKRMDEAEGAVSENMVGSKSAAGGSRQTGLRAGACARIKIPSPVDRGRQTILASSDGTGQGQDAGISLRPGDFFENFGLMKAIAEEALSATLQEEMEEVNGQEAYRIDCTLTGDMLKELARRSGKTGSSGLDISQLDWSQVQIPSRIYIYKDSGLPARIVMDCRTIGDALLGPALSEALGDSPLGALAAEVVALDVDVAFDRYDEIAPIEIPQEALEAGSGGDLLEGILDKLP